MVNEWCRQVGTTVQMRCRINVGVAKFMLGPKLIGNESRRKEELKQQKKKEQEMKGSSVVNS